MQLGAGGWRFGVVSRRADDFARGLIPRVDGSVRLPSAVGKGIEERGDERGLPTLDDIFPLAAG